MAEQLIWIAGDASTFTFYDASTTCKSVGTIEGFGLPTLEHQMQPYPFVHGMLDVARKFRNRTVMFPFQQRFSTRAAWQTGRETLRDALNPALGRGTLKYVDANSIEWRLDAWVVNAPMPRQKFRYNVLESVIELIIPYPFWRKASSESEVGTFNDASSVDISVSNDGNLAVTPTTVTLEAAAGETITNPVLTIISSGKKIDIENTISAGETVTITCWPPEDVAVTKDGTSIIGDLSYDSALVGFSLPKGNSTVRIVGEATSDGDATIEFYERFLAV